MILPQESLLYLESCFVFLLFTLCELIREAFRVSFTLPCTPESTYVASSSSSCGQKRLESLTRESLKNNLLCLLDYPEEICNQRNLLKFVYLNI